MKEEEIINIFKKTGALLEGHFCLTSGLHSPSYIEKFRVLEHPNYTEKLCKEIAKVFKDSNVNIVCGPMTGGIILAHETAKALHTKMVFTERIEGKMIMRRGFKLSETDRVLIVEDVVTTGSSVLEVIDVIKNTGAEIVGIGAIADRSSGRVKFPCKFSPLISFDIETYSPELCPLCSAGIPLQKPGSTNK